MDKKCSICLEVKSIDLFVKKGNQCKLCQKKYLLQWHKNNPNYDKTKQKERYINNKEKICAKNKKYHIMNKKIISLKRHMREQNNPDLIKHKKQYEKQHGQYRYKNDVNYRLKKILRSRLKYALKKNHKGGSAVRDLGCSISKLKICLQLKFHRSSRGKHEYMTWDNQGHWEIDHIRPLSSFDLTDPAQVKQACHYTNLQPLWAIDNLKKSNHSYL